MSVPFQLVVYEQAVAAREGRRLSGRDPEVRAFTIRVGNKDALRADLERGFGYSYQSLFPDPPGYRDYGVSWR